MVIFLCQIKASSAYYLIGDDAFSMFFTNIFGQRGGWETTHFHPL